MKSSFKSCIFILLYLTGSFAVQEVERFAVIAGVNDGGENRQILKYSVNDAVDFSNVMFEMGGLNPGNTILLKDPSIRAFDSALHAINELVATRPSHQRKEVLIYYSGHADENGLLFGNHSFDYHILRKAIDSIKSDVKITILDACASGSITRIKGGTKKKAFLVDASSNLTGYAFITSSSEQEASQESDNIKGSFFTHYLVSGLRGAADMSSDGKITLSEAYQFAFHETLAGTESTANGPQHPSYDMRLTGSGDVVMTDIRTMTALIKFPSDMSGRIFVRNSENQLIAEMMKQKGKVIEIGVPPGTVSIQLNTSNESHEGIFTVRNDSAITIYMNELRSVTHNKLPFKKKGTSHSQKNCHHATAGITLRDSLKLKGIAISLLGNISYDTAMGIQYSLFSNEARVPFTGLQRARFGKNHSKATFTGVQKALIFNIAESDLKGTQLSLLANITGNDCRGAQITAGVNSCHETFSGIQFGSISFIKGDLNGLSLNPLGTVSMGKTYGVQIGALTYSRGLRGAQISPHINIADSGGFMGVQIAALSNISNGKGDGIQCAALYNQSKDVNGIQIGLVNKADTVKGVQIGLINFSNDMYGYPVGLFNYSRKGVFALCTWYDEQTLTHLTLQSGTRNFYNSFTAAFGGNGTKATGFGMGFRIPLRYVAIESDIHHLFTFRHLNDKFESYDITEKVRLNIVTRFIPLLSISAGPSYNFLFNFDRKQNADLIKISKINLRRIDQGIYSWPGFHFGIAVGRF